MKSLDVYSKDPDVKSSAIRAMFEQIAPRYDLLNHILSFSLDKRWRRFAVHRAGVGLGDSVLDVCCGTGDFAFELAKAVGKTCKVQAVDFCMPMVDIAREKQCRLGIDNVVFASADALSLPFEDNSFDFVTIGFGLRNIGRACDALKEMRRVLVPGGKVVCLEASRVRVGVLSWAWHVYFCRAAPLIARLFGGDKQAYRYLPDSVMAFFSREELCWMMEDAGFTNTDYYDIMFGAVCLHIAEKPK